MEKITRDNTTFLITTINSNKANIEKMVEDNNLFGTVFVGCQNHNSEEELKFHTKDAEVTIFFQKTIGTSVNRNYLLSKVKTKYCFFLDDDIKFLDYEFDIINESLSDYKTIDFVFFDFVYKDSSIKKVKWKLKRKIRAIDMRSYGTNSVLYNVEFIKSNNLLFNENIGPGCYIFAGEDGNFLMRASKKAKDAYSCKKVIIEISYENGSTWFRGYDERFFQTIGYTYRIAYGIFASLFAVYSIIKHRKEYLKTNKFFFAYSNIRKGIRLYDKTK